jgi:hypothetical protein
MIFITDGAIGMSQQKDVMKLIESGSSEGNANAFTVSVQNQFNKLSTEGRYHNFSSTECTENIPTPESSSSSSKVASLTTLFCLGIGHGVHRGMMEQMAGTTGGVTQFVTDDAGLTIKCAYLKKCALRSDAETLINPRFEHSDCILRTVPAVLPPRMFFGEPLKVLADVVQSQNNPALVLTATRKLDGAPVRVVASLDLDDTSKEVNGEALITLHAMAYIDSLLHG